MTPDPLQLKMKVLELEPLASEESGRTRDAEHPYRFWQKFSLSGKQRTVGIYIDLRKLANDFSLSGCITASAGVKLLEFTPLIIAGDALAGGGAVAIGREREKGSERKGAERKGVGSLFPIKTPDPFFPPIKTPDPFFPLHDWANPSRYEDYVETVTDTLRAFKGDPAGMWNALQEIAAKLQAGTFVW